MAMNSLSCAEKLYSYYKGDLWRTRDWRKYNFGIFISETLDAEFQKATRTTTNFVITPPAGSLGIDACLNVYKHKVTPRGFARCMAAKAAAYWSKAIAPGSPNCLNFVDSVVNDASKISGPIASELLALRFSKDSLPYFKKFCDIFINNARTIQWTIVEGEILPKIGLITDTCTGNVI